MIPSYADGQVLFVNRLAYGLQGPIIGEYLWIWKAPNLGDAVVVKRPDAGPLVVKRVAGLPGMSLNLHDHSLTVGNRTVSVSPSQEYWLSACSRVPDGFLFLLGDNLDRSMDSRDWGFVPFHDVLGRSFF
jgi:signal peptidase I